MTFIKKYNILNSTGAYQMWVKVDEYNLKEGEKVFVKDSSGKLFRGTVLRALGKYRIFSWKRHEIEDVEYIFDWSKVPPIEEWNVFDRVRPEPKQAVVYYCEDFGKHVGIFEEPCYFGGPSGFSNDDVTHWLPIG